MVFPVSLIAYSRVTWLVESNIFHWYRVRQRILLLSWSCIQMTSRFFLFVLHTWSKKTCCFKQRIRNVKCEQWNMIFYTNHKKVVYYYYLLLIKLYLCFICVLNCICVCLQISYFIRIELLQIYIHYYY